MIYKLIAIGLVLAIAALGWNRYFAVQKKWEADKAVWQANYDKQVGETERIQAAWNTSKEQENEWKDKAEIAGNDAAAVAVQLRRAKARASSCAVPGAAGDTGTAGPSSEESSELGSLEKSHFRNCALDAADFDSIRGWYNGLRAAQQAISSGTN